ncbi:hypothetical protein FQZ97_875900 [compost metagenome]
MSHTSAADALLAQYGQRYDQATRNIAELINAIPSPSAPWVEDTLRECVKLYAAQRGIKEADVYAATEAHAVWERALFATGTQAGVPM